MLAGSAENSSLQNIQAIGSNSVTGLANVGGLVGQIRNTGPTKLLKNLSFFGAVQITPNPPAPAPETNYHMIATNNYIGGVIGDLEGTLETVSFSGTVLGGYQVGGIVGKLKGTLRSAYTRALSKVAGNYIGGGIAGVLESGGLITQSVSLADIAGFPVKAPSVASLNHDQFGGLVGHAMGSIARSYASGSITNVDRAAGGLVGLYEGLAPESITDSYASVSLIGWGTVMLRNSGGLVGELKPSAKLIMRRSFITDWSGNASVNRSNVIYGFQGTAASPTLDGVYFPSTTSGGTAPAGAYSDGCEQPDF